MSQKNRNEWLWTENIPKPDAKNFMLACIQDYVVKMYDNDKTDLVKVIGEKVLSVYPDHIESFSNIAIAYFIEKDFDKALEYLFKAEKLAPKDVVVLNNIAWAYAQKKESKKAIDYYEKVIKYGDEDAKEYANKQILDLKNK
ncbi:MAG: tetratricopeptide repeat protein [Bacteroidia bacterium]|nr:tetratricopeptide repeat protein [Bacteroidia bacterium]